MGDCRCENQIENETIHLKLRPSKHQSNKGKCKCSEPKSCTCKSVCGSSKQSECLIPCETKEEQCDCGPKLYSSVLLGPTIDESILVALAAFLKFYSNCPTSATDTESVLNIENYGNEIATKECRKLESARELSHRTQPSCSPKVNLKISTSFTKKSSMDISVSTNFQRCAGCQTLTTSVTNLKLQTDHIECQAPKPACCSCQSSNSSIQVNLCPPTAIRTHQRSKCPYKIKKCRLPKKVLCNDCSSKKNYCVYGPRTQQHEDKQNCLCYSKPDCSHRKNSGEKLMRKISCEFSNSNVSITSCEADVELERRNVEHIGDDRCHTTRYAITKITKFPEYTTFEVLQSTKKKPKDLPTLLEGVFVLKNKKCI